MLVEYWFMGLEHALTTARSKVAWFSVSLAPMRFNLSQNMAKTEKCYSIRKTTVLTRIRDLPAGNSSIVRLTEVKRKRQAPGGDGTSSLACQPSRVATPQSRVRSAGRFDAMFGRLPPITTTSDIVATSPQTNAPSLPIFLTFTVWFSIYIAAAFAAFYISTWPPPRPSRFTYVHLPRSPTSRH
jgi:hypothetical protein